eukprot:1161237-Pelagomonas_calceolata.AAC.5
MLTRRAHFTKPNVMPKSAPTPPCSLTLHARVKRSTHSACARQALHSLCMRASSAPLTLHAPCAQHARHALVCFTHL